MNLAESSCPTSQSLKERILAVITQSSQGVHTCLLPDELRYTAKGSELYEYIKLTPNYYLNRAEVDILTTRKDEIMRSGNNPEDQSSVHTLIDLGAGYGDKARLLLPGIFSNTFRENQKVRYIAVDVSLGALIGNKACMEVMFPQVETHMLHATYDEGIKQALDMLREDQVDICSNRISFLFAGGTIGNMKAGEDAKFIGNIQKLIETHAPEFMSLWRLLLGVDIAPGNGTKSETQVVNAYDNDTSGFRAAFMDEIFKQVNKLVKTNLCKEDWNRKVRWDAEESAVIQEFVCNKDVKVHVATTSKGTLEGDDLLCVLPTGSKLGVSRHKKYTEDGLERISEAFGVHVTNLWKSTNQFFAFVEMKPKEVVPYHQPKIFQGINKNNLSVSPWLNVVNISELCHSRDEHILRSVASQLSVGLEKLGLVMITGYQNLIPEEVLVEARQAMLEFCAQPQEMKDVFNKKRGFGFGGYLKQEENGGQLLGNFDSPPDMVEQFTVQGLCYDDTCEEEKKCDGNHYDKREDRVLMLTSTSRVKKSDIPETLFDSIMKAQVGWSKVRSVLNEVARVALNVSKKEFEELIDLQASGIRYAHYHPCLSEKIGKNQMRYGAHTDSGGFTCLFLDPNNPDGLQVKLPTTGEWLDVPYVPGSFIVNVGEILSSWTGKFWKAPIHQVTMGDLSRSRVSIVVGAVAPNIKGPDVETFSSHEKSKDEKNRGLGKVNVSSFLAARASLHQDQYQVKNKA